MIVVTILGIAVMFAPDLFKQVRRFFFMSSARIEIQRDARKSIDLITRRLRQAKSSTIVMDRLTGQPYYSKLSFQDIDGISTIYYQNGKNLCMVVNGSTTTLSPNLRYLAFALPRSDNMGIVSVSLTLEKTTYESRTKALHMASEKVRVMN